jgi:hypothetical protein
LLALLGPNGEAPDGVIEHSRGRTVSAAVVTELVEACGGQVLVQEVIDWVHTGLTDAMTTFGRAADFPGHTAVHLVNPRFMEEAAAIRQFQSPYGRLPR